MNMRFSVTHLPMGLALGGSSLLIVLWLSYPEASIQGTRSLPRKAVLPPKEAPPAGEGPQGARVLSRQGAAPPSANAAAPTGTRSASPIPLPQGGRPGGRWDHMPYLQGIAPGQGEAGCHEAIRRTAAHLSIDPAQAADFEISAKQSVLEMEQALERRKRELSTLPPAEGPSVPSEQERRSEERYAAARSKALGRLERFLAQNTVHQEFRWAFDSWASMVAVKVR